MASKQLALACDVTNQVGKAGPTSSTQEGKDSTNQDSDLRLLVTSSLG